MRVRNRLSRKTNVSSAQPITNKDVWEDSMWGSREAFIRARMEKEGYSLEAAERSANVWESAIRDLKANPPKPLRRQRTTKRP